MRKIKKLAALVCTLSIGTAACVGLAGCGGEKYDIYVGNTAGTTGALAAIGAPFNYGIKAALDEYNQKGGFTGKFNGKDLKNGTVGFKTYDDGGKATDTVTYTERLIEEDNVFAIVGNFGSYGVTANLDMIKDAKVPMVYAAAGNEEMAKDTATGADRYIFPVQPINSTEGRTLIQRAFLPVADGGLGGTKVGVISNNGDASLALLKGIKAEAENLTADQKSNINYQEVSDTTTGYASAATALKNANCDVIIVALTTDYITTINALMDAGYNSLNVKILTSYNNAATTLFDDSNAFNTSYAGIINAIYSQAWLDISSPTYKYNREGGLFDEYKALAKAIGSEGAYDEGVPGFNEEYWNVAEVLYNYGVANASSVPAGYTAFTLSYDAYALAGYIAGNLFCQGLSAVENSGKELTRENYVDTMESKSFHLAMASEISFANGKRLGVDGFALNNFYGKEGSKTLSFVVSPIETLDQLRAK